MKWLLYSETVLMASAFAGLLYGSFRCILGKRPLYAVMAVLGVGCIFLGSFHTVVRLLTDVPTRGVFQTGTLGTVGAFMFFFSANYGQIDSLVDDGTPAFRKYRLTAACGTAAAAALSLLILFSPAPAGEKAGGLLGALAVCMSSYFHIKHLVIPDVEKGVVSCQRLYNAVLLCLGLLCITKSAALAYDRYYLYTLLTVPQCILTAAAVPAVDTGVSRWSE